jgi:hypothetical protein
MTIDINRFDQDKAQPLSAFLVKMVQSFQPPQDMSINEKQAFKEGVYWAFDFLMEKGGNHLTLPPIQRKLRWWEVKHDSRCNIEVLGAEPLAPDGDCTCGAVR